MLATALTGLRGCGKREDERGGTSCGCCSVFFESYGHKLAKFPERSLENFKAQVSHTNDVESFQ